MANLIDKFKVATGINDPYATEILSKGDDLAVKYIPSGAGVDKIKKEITSEILADESNGGAIVIDPDKFLTDIAAGKAKLSADIVLAEPLVITKDTVVDLNGYSISSATDIFDVSAKLTINGEGKIMAATDNTCSWCAVFAHDNAEVVINGGEYSIGAPEGDYNDLIYAKDNAKITINGGTYHSAGTVRKDGTAFVLNLKDNTAAKITVNGGKFENFNPAEANTEPGGLYNFLADGYETVAEGDWFVVREIVLTGSTEDVVVEEETQE
jgi:hypothetical protein